MQAEEQSSIVKQTTVNSFDIWRMNTMNYVFLLYIVSSHIYVYIFIFTDSNKIFWKVSEYNGYIFLHQTQ